MRRSRPEAEACGVWLDAAALKRRKGQTHLIKLGTKMLTLFPAERKPSISSVQRISSTGTRQSSIASFFTLQPGLKNDGNQRSISSHTKSLTNEESKKDAMQLDDLIQGSGDDGFAPPLATSTPADIQETHLFPPSLQASGQHSTGTPFSTVLPLPQPDTLVCAGESKASLSSSFTQDLESSCLLDQKEDKKNCSRKREWLHGSNKNHRGVERHIRAPGGKCQQPLAKVKLERKVSAKEHRQAPVCLQTYRDSWSRENSQSVKQSCPVPVFSWENEKNKKDSWSQLFTEDSQGQQVIAHNIRAPFQDVTNAWDRGLGQFPACPQPQYQDGPTQVNLQPDLLFTQDSEGNQVIKHQF